MAVQAQRAVVANGETLHSQTAIVQQRIALALHDPGKAAVDSQQGAFGQQGGHAVAWHAEADGVCRCDLQGLQGPAGDRLVVPGQNLQTALLQVMQGQMRHVRVQGQQWRRQGTGRTGRSDGAKRGRMLRAFATAQPAHADAEQIGYLLESGLGHAAFEPVVDVLRRDLALGGKV